jgi:hypothetical protein
MAKLPFALKAGHPMGDAFIGWKLRSDEWEEVDTGVWGFCSMEDRHLYSVVLLSRDCGAELVVPHPDDILEVIRAARRIREDQHEADVARATGEAP